MTGAYTPLMKIDLPDGQYLMKIGLLVYFVSEFEGMLITDLPRFQSVLPPELNFFTLEGMRVTGMTTTSLGKYLMKHSARSSDPEVAAYFHAGGKALTDIGPYRNAVLHARPGIDGNDPQQRLRLLRFRVGSETDSEMHMISDEWLDSLLVQIGVLRMQVIALRPEQPPVEDQGVHDEPRDELDKP